MNERHVALVILSIATTASLVNSAAILPATWQILNTWQVINLILSLLVTVATLFMAYFLLKDYKTEQKEIEKLVRRISDLENSQRKQNA